MVPPTRLAEAAECMAATVERRAAVGRMAKTGRTVAGVAVVACAATAAAVEGGVLMVMGVMVV